MFGHPGHLDDVAVQRARAVSIWAARMLAAARSRAEWALVEVVRAAEVAVRTAAHWARRLRAWSEFAFTKVAARLAPTIASARTDWRYLRSVLAPVALCAVLAGGAATVAAPGVLILAAGYSVLARPVVVAAPALPPEPVLPDYVTFIDRFDTLDDQRWIFSDGWHNGYWVENDWRRDTLHPSANGMAIVMTPNPPGAEKPFASGELQSQELYRYGYFEVRMRIPRGSGIGVGFFTYSEPEGRSSWQEIDVEFIGRSTNHIELNYHLGGRTRGDRIGLPFDAADAFHTYAFEWTPEGIRWYVDNRLAYELTDTGAQRLTNPQRLYLSLWTSKITVWAGELDRTQAPWTLDVSCLAQAREYRGVSLCAP